MKRISLLLIISSFCMQINAMQQAQQSEQQTIEIPEPFDRIRNNLSGKKTNISFEVNMLKSYFDPKLKNAALWEAMHLCSKRIFELNQEIELIMEQNKKTDETSENKQDAEK